MHIPESEFELLFGLTPSPLAGGGLLGNAPGIFTGAEGGAPFPPAEGAAVGAGFPGFWYCEAIVWRSDNAIGMADAI